MSLKRRTLLNFAGPGLLLHAMGLPAVVYLPPYYAGELGMGLAAVGLIFFLVRAIDLPLDVFIGAMMDRTNSRWGRFRPWIGAGGLLMGIGVWLVFFAKPGTPPWLGLLFLLVAYAGQSSLWLSQTSWGSQLSADYNERSRIFGWWQLLNVAGLLMIAAIPPLLGGTAAENIHAMGWFAIAMVPLTILPVLLWLPEPVNTAPSEHAAWRDIVSLTKNKLLMRLLVADLLVSLAPGVTGALFRFYFEHVLGYDGRQTGALLLIYFTVGLLTIPFWGWLARRASKHRTLAIAGIAYAILQTGVVLLPPNSFEMAMVGMGIAGLPYAAGAFLLRAILADVIDVDRLQTGADRTGLLSAVLTTTGKIGYAIPVGAAYGVLALVGFNATPGAVNTDFATGSLIALFTILPATIMLVMSWRMWSWPHDAVEHARVQSELAARDAARAAA